MWASHDFHISLSLRDKCQAAIVRRYKLIVVGQFVWNLVIPLFRFSNMMKAVSCGRISNSELCGYFCTSSAQYGLSVIRQTIFVSTASSSASIYYYMWDFFRCFNEKIKLVCIFYLQIKYTKTSSGFVITCFINPTHNIDDNKDNNILFLRCICIKLLL